MQHNQDIIKKRAKGMFWGERVDNVTFTVESVLVVWCGYSGDVWKSAKSGGFIPTIV
jgi:hypothetical protein